MYSYYYDSSRKMGYLYGRMRIAKQPTSIVPAVKGIFRRNPPILGISFVPQA